MILAATFIAWSGFALCIRGPACEVIDSAAAVKDLNGDGFIDLRDAALFQHHFSCEGDKCGLWLHNPVQ